MWFALLRHPAARAGIRNGGRHIRANSVAQSAECAEWKSKACRAAGRLRQTCLTRITTRSGPQSARRRAPAVSAYVLDQAEQRNPGPALSESGLLAALRDVVLLGALAVAPVAVGVPASRDDRRAAPRIERLHIGRGEPHRQTTSSAVGTVCL